MLSVCYCREGYEFTDREEWLRVADLFSGIPSSCALSGMWSNDRRELRKVLSVKAIRRGGAVAALIPAARLRINGTRDTETNRITK